LRFVGTVEAEFDPGGSRVELVVGYELFDHCFLMGDFHLQAEEVVKEREDNGGYLGVERRDMAFGKALGKSCRCNRSCGFLSCLIRRGGVDSSALGACVCVGREFGVSHCVVVVAVVGVVGSCCFVLLAVVGTR